MASGSAMQQDSLLVCLGGDGASELLPLAYFAFGIKKQIKRKPMAGVLAPEGSQYPHAISAC